MFDSKHYVPILRWKAAEKEALEQLTSKEKVSMTPLFEILMPQPKNPKAGERVKSPAELLTESLEALKVTLPKIPSAILKYWGELPAFIDLSLVDVSLRSVGMKQIVTGGEAIGVPLIPVIGLSTDTKTQNVAFGVAKKKDRGLCLRLFRPDLIDSVVLAQKIKAVLATSALSEKHIDLLIDFKNTDEECLKLTDLCGRIPNLLKWRTFTVASGAFPPDLTNLSVDLHFKDRADWNAWLDQRKKNLPRKPSFADYTIQHPIYKDPVRGSNPSASIRYTLKNQWMIMRGQALRGKNTKGHAQYPAVARMVSEREEFFGEKFSFGDKYIADKGKDLKSKQTGTPRTWLRAGINHHLACTVSQISSLS
jgi:Beta protein